MRRIALACPFVAAAVCLFACSSSTPSSPPQDGGTGAGDAAEPATVDSIADWSCLGKVKVPAPEMATIPFDFGLADPFTGKVVKGATVKSCARTDTACASPFETVVSDDLGFAAFKLPTGAAGFDGFFEVQVGSEIPNLNYHGDAFSRKGADQRLYWGDSQLSTLFASSAVARDPALATIGVQAHDCKESPGGVPCGSDPSCSTYIPGGVSFSIDVQDPKIVLGYIQSAGSALVISTKATSTTALVGLAGFLNVPAGPITVTAKVAATGQIIGSYPMTARAGAMTLLVANAH